MPDHDAEVAAVLTQALFNARCGGSSQLDDLLASVCVDEALVCLAALSAAGYAVVKLPEGVEVAHGARLVHRGWFGTPENGTATYTVEDTP